MLPASFKGGLARVLEYLLNSPVCLACGVGLEGGSTWCPDCARHLRRVIAPCRYCAQPNPVPGPICPACLGQPPRWQGMIAPLQYRGLTREYLLRLKFSEDLFLARALCRACCDPFRAVEPKPEVLLPVPLHRDRLLGRGFNQALEIAAHWSRLLDIPIDRHSLRRGRATPSQSGLSAAQRAKNVRGVFEYRPRKFYRHVAVVDDIVTTGSTADEITRVMHRAGVEHVDIWALARVCRR